MEEPCIRFYIVFLILGSPEYVQGFHLIVLIFVSHLYHQCAFMFILGVLICRAELDQLNG